MILYVCDVIIRGLSSASREGSVVEEAKNAGEEE
jgi:hypothetical protein